MRRNKWKLLKVPGAFLLSVMVAVTMIPSIAFAGENEEEEENPIQVTFVYSDSGITAYEGDYKTKEKADNAVASGESKIIASTDSSVSTTTSVAGTSFGSDYEKEIFSLGTDTDKDGYTTTLCYKGEYFFLGSCTDGNIFVKKDSYDSVDITLYGLDLTEPDEGECPIQCKGGTTRVKIKAQKGTENTLTDAKHVDEDGEAISPKACINASKKIKLGGKGTLTVNGNNKNGIKSDTVIELSSSINLSVKSVDNAISADKEVRTGLDLEDGDWPIVTIESGGKGICSTPDVLEAEIDDDDGKLEYNGLVTLEGGKYDITATDDAIHSNRDVTITRGEFDIETGDDAIHADYDLIVGAEDGTTTPDIDITQCYEGLEAETVNVYSGDIDLVSSDDGLNAVNPDTKNSEGTGGGTGGGGQGQPGDDRPEKPDDDQDEGGKTPPGKRSESSTELAGDQSSTQSSATSGKTAPEKPDGPGTGGDSGTGGGGTGMQADTAAQINIYGGNIYAKASGDGFDSNGDINISGGTTEVYSGLQDNAALDCDGSIYFTGGTVFAAGGSNMAVKPVTGDGYQAYSLSTSSANTGDEISIDDNNTTVKYTLPCGIQHYIYTSPTLNGGSGTMKTQLGTATLTDSSATYTYTGNAYTPAVTVTDKKGNTLTKGTDYTVTYSSNTNAGYATINVKANADGNYTGAKNVHFTINPIDFSESATVTTSADSYNYTGSAITPAVTVKYSNKTLTKDTDYTVEYEDNTAVGTATIIVTGAGNYTGTVEKTFEIVENGGTDSEEEQPGGDTPPDKPDGEGGEGGGEGGQPGGGGADTQTFDYSGSYSGVLVADGTSKDSTGETYTSSTKDQNVALAQNGGTLTIKNGTLNKSGDDNDGDNCNFYGLNSSVLAVGSSSKIYISDSSISSTSTGSNGIFATDNATVFANNDTITTTTGGNARGLDATYGGSIIANKMTINTAKDHCAALATDRGGGYISVTNSDLKTAGSGSPLIYSTGDIEIDNTTGTTTGSQIAGMEGLNKILIYNSNLSSTNNATSGSDPIKDAVILYQSTSGDADTSTAEKSDFQAKDSTLKTSITGDSSKDAAFFYVTNVTANVVLDNTTLDFDSDSVYLLYASGNNSNNWGTEGKNGGKVTFTAIDESALDGDIYVGDTYSSADVYLTQGTKYTGKTAGSGVSKANINVDSTSTWVVTGNCSVGNLNIASGGKVVDASGKTVTIKTSGSTVQTGTSDITVTVTGSYGTTVTAPATSVSGASVSRTAFDSYYGTNTTFGNNGSSADPEESETCDHSWNTTWSSNDSHHWHECSKCHEQKDKAEHTWNSDIVTKEATATENGIRTYTCTVCGKTKTETIEDTGESGGGESGGGTGGGSTGGGGTGGGAVEQSNVTTDSSGNISTDLSSSVTVADGKVEATLTTEDAAEIAETAKSSGSTEVTITGASKSSSATESVVTVPASLFTDLSNLTKLETLSIVTDVAKEISLDKEALKSIASEIGTAGSNQTVSLNVSKNNYAPENTEVTTQSNKTVVESILSAAKSIFTASNTTTQVRYDITLKTGDKTISNLGDGKETVTIAIPKEIKKSYITAGENPYEVLYVDDNGEYSELGDDNQSLVDKNTYTFTTSHNSCYAFMLKTEAQSILTAQKEAQEEAQAQKAITAVKGTTVKIRSAVAYKNGKITVSWKKADGYDVDGYIIYRSTNKKAGFKKLATVNSNTFKYTDSKKLKKGKKYYYKVCGYAKVKDTDYYTNFTTVKYAKCKKTRK